MTDRPPSPPVPAHRATRGLVVAAHQVAAAAGAELLGQGGSAADAAVGAAAVMAVTGPHLCGLGGDMLAVVSVPGAAPLGLLGVGRAPAGADAARLRAAGHDIVPARHLAAVTVPGAADGWLALHQRFGRLPWARVLAPAAALAAEGFAVPTLLALASLLVADGPGGAVLCGGGPLRPGQRLALPGVARTLAALAEGGRDAFYGGEFGRALLDLAPGYVTPDDLAAPSADWVTPLRLEAWGHDLWTVPAPSQGYLTLAGAAVAERAGLPADPGDDRWPHVIVEAARAVAHDRPACLHQAADGAALLDEERLSAAVARIDWDRAAPPDVHPGARRGPRTGGDTTHLCAIDADGMGVTLTQSNALDFGSHLVAGDTGVFLHNRGVGFSLEPGHPAELAPGRRPPHTLSPGLATRPDGSLALLFGTMGGDAQPQILLQLLARVLASGQGPAEALTAARVVLEAPSAPPFRLWWGEDLTVRVEDHAPDTWATGLARRGHRVQPVDAYNPTVVGCAQLVAWDPADRVAVGGADPRSPEGGAVGR